MPSSTSFNRFSTAFCKLFRAFFSSAVAAASLKPIRTSTFTDVLSTTAVLSNSSCSVTELFCNNVNYTDKNKETFVLARRVGPETVDVNLTALSISLSVFCKAMAPRLLS